MSATKFKSPRVKTILWTLAGVLILGVVVRRGQSAGQKPVAVHDVVISPAPAAASGSRQLASVATKSPLAAALRDDTIGRRLQEGFELADGAAARGLDAYLAKLDREPRAARRMISAGLERLPKTPEFADQRAGLLDLIPRFAAGDAAWAAGQLEAELVGVPTAPRPRVREALTEQDYDRALSVTPDVARSQIAFEDLLKVRGDDCSGLEGSMVRIMSAQQDQLLRQNFARRFNYTCPHSTLTWGEI